MTTHSDDYTSEVERALEGSGVVPKGDYLRWARSSDLATQARAYRFSSTAWSRIRPEPSMEEQCQFIMNHLLACIETDPTADEYLESGFEASRSLALWLKHLNRTPGTATMIADAANELALLYKRLDANGRNRIETGALEHILESPALRPYFDSWQHDHILREAYIRALEWGLAHTDMAG